MEVVGRRAQVDAEKRDVGERETPATVYGDQILQGVPGERLEDHDQGWLFENLVGAHDVQVREPLEDATLLEQPAPPLAVVGAVRAQDLGDAAAGPLFAPYLVDVEDAAPVEVARDLVAR